MEMTENNRTIMIQQASALTDSPIVKYLERETSALENAIINNYMADVTKELASDELLGINSAGWKIKDCYALEMGIIHVVDCRLTNEDSEKNIDLEFHLFVTGSVELIMVRQGENIVAEWVKELKLKMRELAGLETPKSLEQIILDDLTGILGRAVTSLKIPEERLDAMYDDFKKMIGYK